MTNVADDLSQPDDAADDGRRQPAGKDRRKRRNRRILVGILITILVLVLGAAGTAWWFVNRLSSNIERIPNAFDIPDASRPAEAGGDSLTFLLGGLDGEDKVDVYEPGAARTDTIMLLHVPEGHDDAYLVSIPRDTYIDIPGHGENKINAAYSLGGPSLFVQTLEQLSGIRIDHLALIDWNGFEALTDALGGVPLSFDQPVQLAGDEGVLPAGDHVLSGEQALQYVRERKGLPGGDFDRVKRQQNYLRALMNEMLSTGTFTSPGTITEVADAVGEAARVDDDLSATDMVQMGLSMRDLRAENVTFLTVPNSGPGQAGSQSIVIYDAVRADQLWQAMREGTMPDFLAANPDLVTGDQVN